MGQFHEEVMLVESELQRIKALESGEVVDEAEVDDVPWDSVSEDWKADSARVVAQGYVDADAIAKGINMTHDYRAFHSDIKFFVEKLLMDKGVAFVRDPSGHIGGLARAKKLAELMKNYIRQTLDAGADAPHIRPLVKQYGFDFEGHWPSEDARHFVEWLRGYVQRAKFTVTEVKGKSGAGFKFVMTPSFQELAKKAAKDVHSFNEKEKARKAADEKRWAKMKADREGKTEEVPMSEAPLFFQKPKGMLLSEEFEFTKDVLSSIHEEERREILEGYDDKKKNDDDDDDDNGDGEEVDEAMASGKTSYDVPVPKQTIDNVFTLVRKAAEDSRHFPKGSDQSKVPFVRLAKWLVKQNLHLEPKIFAFFRKVAGADVHKVAMMMRSVPPLAVSPAVTPVIATPHGEDVEDVVEGEELAEAVEKLDHVPPYSPTYRARLRIHPKDVEDYGGGKAISRVKLGNNSQLIARVRVSDGRYSGFGVKFFATTAMPMTLADAGYDVWHMGRESRMDKWIALRPKNVKVDKKARRASWSAYGEPWELETWAKTHGIELTPEMRAQVNESEVHQRGLPHESKTHRFLDGIRAIAEEMGVENPFDEAVAVGQTSYDVRSPTKKGMPRKGGEASKKRVAKAELMAVAERTVAQLVKAGYDPKYVTVVKKYTGPVSGGGFHTMVNVYYPKSAESEVPSTDTFFKAWKAAGWEAHRIQFGVMPDPNADRNVWRQKSDKRFEAYLSVNRRVPAIVDVHLYLFPEVRKL